MTAIIRHLLIGAAIIFVFFALALFTMDKSICISILAGALTGLSEGTIMFPLENLKIQQQLDGSSLWQVLKRTYAKYGVLGFFRGLTPVLVGAIPTQAIRWGCYEAYCSIADCHNSLLHVTIGGVISGIINAFVTGVPIETLKTSMIHSHWADTAAPVSPCSSTSINISSSSTSSGGNNISARNSNNNNINNSVGSPHGCEVEAPATFGGTHNRNGVLLPNGHSSNDSHLPSHCESQGEFSITVPEEDFALHTAAKTINNHHHSHHHSRPSALSCQDVLAEETVCISAQSQSSLIPKPAHAHARVFSTPINNQGVTVGNFRTTLATPQAKTAALKSSGYPRFQGKQSAFRGYFPTVAKKVLNQAIRFPAHAWTLGLLCSTFGSETDIAHHCQYNHPTLNFCAGTFAGFSSIFITQPIDVAKTRMQGLDGHRFHHTAHCLRTIVAEEGYSALTHGIVSRTLRASIGAGITFMLFPFFKGVLEGLL